MELGAGSLGFGVSGSASKGGWTAVLHGKPAWLTGGDYGLEASVVTSVMLGLVLAALVRWKGVRARGARSPLTLHLAAFGETA